MNVFNLKKISVFSIFTFIALTSSVNANEVFYEYDALGRMKSACYKNSGKKIVYTYDAVGNRTKKELKSVTCVDPNADPGVNNPPVAVNDNPVSGPVFESIYVYPLSNDSDPDGDNLQLVSATSVTSGCYAEVFSANRVEILSAGATYCTINYTINDGRGGTASAQIFQSFTSGGGFPSF